MGRSFLAFGGVFRPVVSRVPAFVCIAGPLYLGGHGGAEVAEGRPRRGLAFFSVTSGTPRPPRQGGWCDKEKRRHGPTGRRLDRETLGLRWLVPPEGHRSRIPPLRWLGPPPTAGTGFVHIGGDFLHRPSTALLVTKRLFFPQDARSAEATRPPGPDRRSGHTPTPFP